jgi:multiple sugar transport system substrate-binding protein
MNFMKGRFWFALSLVLVASMLLVRNAAAGRAGEGHAAVGFLGQPRASHERVAQAYMAEHPEVQFEYMFAPWDEYFTKLRTVWAGGDPTVIPDILFLWPTPSYAATGVLENLQPYIEASGYDLDDYWPYLLDSARYQGDIYGLPRDIEAHVLYYNKKLFDEAGVAYPTEDWTWDDLLVAAEKLTKKDASGRVTQYALGMEGGKWPIWVGQAGGMMLDDLSNPSKCTLDTPEAIKGLQFSTTSWTRAMPFAAPP